MRAYIEIPDALLPALQEQAHAAHRPPRYHLEWLICQLLQHQPAPEEPCPLDQPAGPPESACYAPD